MNKGVKWLIGIGSCATLIAGSAVAASEVLLYLTSNGHADLSRIVDKTMEGDRENFKRKLIDEDLQWLKRQNTVKYTIKSEEGFKLHGEYLPAKELSDKMIFCIHGVQTTGRREFATAIRFFFENGFNTFYVDQRSYGESEGKYCTYGHKESADCKAWLDFVAREFGPNMKILVYGVSMGSSTTILLNNYKIPVNVAGFVADCGYSSVRKQIKTTFQKAHIPAGLSYFAYKHACLSHRIYNPDKVDIISAVSQCTLPILFIHGDEDEVVPPENVYDLYEACPSSHKKLLITKNAGHAQSFALSKEAREAIINFI